MEYSVLDYTWNLSKIVVQLKTINCTHIFVIFFIHLDDLDFVFKFFKSGYSNKVKIHWFCIFIHFINLKPFISVIRFWFKEEASDWVMKLRTDFTYISIWAPSIYSHNTHLLGEKYLKKIYQLSFVKKSKSSTVVFV